MSRPEARRRCVVLSIKIRIVGIRFPACIGRTPLDLGTEHGEGEILISTDKPFVVVRSKVNHSPFGDPVETVDMQLALKRSSGRTGKSAKQVSALIRSFIRHKDLMRSVYLLVVGLLEVSRHDVFGKLVRLVDTEGFAVWLPRDDVLIPIDGSFL